MATGGAKHQRAWQAQAASELWTRRQSPEWRPRRASVAVCSCACQQQPCQRAAGSPVSLSARRLLGAFESGERRGSRGRRHMSCTLPAPDAAEVEAEAEAVAKNQEAGAELGHNIKLERKSIIYSMALRQLAREHRHRCQRSTGLGSGLGGASTCCHDDLAGSNGEQRASRRKSGGGSGLGIGLGGCRSGGCVCGGASSSSSSSGLSVPPTDETGAAGETTNDDDDDEQQAQQQKVAAASDVGERRRLSSGDGGASDSANSNRDDSSSGRTVVGKQADQFQAAPMATAAEDEAQVQRQAIHLAGPKHHVDGDEAEEEAGTTPDEDEEEEDNKGERRRRRRGGCGNPAGQRRGLDNLEALIVESWLDDHPHFVHDYFMRKASRQLIDDWLVANAKVNSSQQVPESAGSGQQPQVIVEHRRFENSGSRRQLGQGQQGSGRATPVRKISATDFESRTGAGFLRPMVSTTPDGRQTFLASEPAEPENGAKTNSESANSTSAGVNGPEAEQKAHEEEADEQEGPKEVRLVFELVKNICQDLDIRTLLYKILKNIALLINADKSSLFLVCGEPGDPQRRLVSQLFDVDGAEPHEPDEQTTITIPWGTGLVGWVAQSGESVNIANCYNDPRFTNAVDRRTGYLTRHMLCAPIFDKRNQIVGVAQVINRRDGRPFSAADEQKFKRYLQFCGIGLSNAQSYENCRLENRRNQLLLDLARMVFEEQSTIEQVVYRIMLHTASLLDCQRCQVLLIEQHVRDDDADLLHLNAPQQHQHSANGAADRPDAAAKPEWRPQCTGLQQQQRQQQQQHQARSPSPAPAKQETAEKEQPKLFSLVFDLECDQQGRDLVMHSCANKDENKRFPINIGITGYVATTGRTLNIEDAHQCERFDPKVDDNSNFRHKSILCMPIRNGRGQIIGVSQLINKKNGRPFNKNDEDLFEAFAIFCGLGIHNTLMYEKVLKIMAKQRVTFEVLSYHATAPLEEAKKLNQEQIPSSLALNLMSLKYDDFSLNEQFMLKSCLRFFLDLDLIRRFQIDKLVFCNWILSVQKNYRKVTYHPIVGGNGLKASPVRYHNWRHAFNVTQMMFAILVNTQICQSLGELETLALLIACLCHDLDHRGTNNSFQIKSASPLAQLYSTSTMEHHHFDQCVMILNSQGNQILANLSPDEYSRVIVLLEEAILATDLANYFQKREHFFQLVNSGQFEWRRNHEHRSLLRCMLMTGCDVAAITKPWRVQKVVAGLVMSEFYQQGDIERQELNIEPIDMMNRDKMSKLPEMQIGFIDSICAPIYAAFARLFPHELGPLLEGCLSNRNVWAEIAKKNNNNNSQPIKPPAKTCAHEDNHQAPLISYLNNRNNSEPIITILPTTNTTNQPTDLQPLENNPNDPSDPHKLDSRHSSSLTLLDIYDSPTAVDQHYTSSAYHLTTTNNHSHHINDEQRRSV